MLYETAPQRFMSDLLSRPCRRPIRSLARTDFTFSSPNLLHAHILCKDSGSEEMVHSAIFLGHSFLETPLLLAKLGMIGPVVITTLDQLQQAYPRATFVTPH